MRLTKLCSDVEGVEIKFSKNIYSWKIAVTTPFRSILREGEGTKAEVVKEAHEAFCFAAFGSSDSYLDPVYFDYMGGIKTPDYVAMTESTQGGVGFTSGRS